ncbi:MAG: hypothetical protein WBZ36_28300 [Candidatus Nitrosopolaris sp.]
MKRCSTLHVSAIASEFVNSAKIIVPCSWFRKRMIAFFHSEFISKHPRAAAVAVQQRQAAHLGVAQAATEVMEATEVMVAHMVLHPRLQMAPMAETVETG